MKRATIYVSLTLLIALVWLFAVTFSYYVSHKPFSGENAVALVNVLGDVATMSLLSALAAAIGRRVLRNYSFALPPERVVFSIGLGFGLVSFATLALGIAGLLQRLLFWALLIALLVLLRGELIATWQDARQLRLPIETGFERVLAFFVVLSIGIAFLFALLPPTSWDAQTYHLVEGKLALERGGIRMPPDIPIFSFPSLVETLFLTAMLLKGDIAAQLIHFVYALLILLLLFAFAMRFFRHRVGWLACAILLAVPSLFALAAQAYVDLALAFYATAAVYLLLVAKEESRWQAYALSGVFAGLAMGVKYTSAIVPLALFVLILVDAKARHWKHALAFVVAAGIVASPWYLRNLAFMGNPFYPFVFGGPYWDSFRSEWFSRFGSGLLNAPLKLLMVPWDATVIGREGGVPYEATIGPLLLAMMPLLLLALFRSQAREDASADPNAANPTRIGQGALSTSLVFVAIFYLYWLVGIAQSKLLINTRLLFPSFPLLALAEAVALDRLSAFDLPQFSLARFSRMLVTLVLGLTLLSYGLTFAMVNPLAFLSGAQTRSQVLAARLGDYYDAVQYINTSLPKDARVMLLWEPRSYYLQRVAQPDSILDGWVHLSRQYQSADKIAAALVQAGYTHVLLNQAGLATMLESGYDPISSTDLDTLQDLARDHLKVVYSGNQISVPPDSRGIPVVLGSSKGPSYILYEVVGSQPN